MVTCPGWTDAGKTTGKPVWTVRCLWKNARQKIHGSIKADDRKELDKYSGYRKKKWRKRTMMSKT
jgi:hypothetical protein